MEDHGIPTASTIGAGIVLNEDNTVGIMVLLGDLIDPEDTETHVPMAGISMDVDTTRAIVNKLVTLIDEAEFAREAVADMGHDAALEYMRAFAKRSSAPFN